MAGMEDRLNEDDYGLPASTRAPGLLLMFHLDFVILGSASVSVPGCFLRKPTSPLLVRTCPTGAGIAVGVPLTYSL